MPCSASSGPCRICVSKCSLPNSAAAAAGSALISEGKDGGSVKALVDGAARQSARALLLPDAMRDGDRPLKDLRIAVLFDEYEANGQPAKTRPVETCVQKRLMD